MSNDAPFGLSPLNDTATKIRSKNAHTNDTSRKPSIPYPVDRVYRADTPLGSRFVPRAEQEELDFDALLQKAADKVKKRQTWATAAKTRGVQFETAENKPVVIGYGVAALVALLFTEWLIHLPGLDFVLGFPIQLLGVLMGPVLILRYLVDKEDWYGDAEGTVDKVASLLPGLKK